MFHSVPGVPRVKMERFAGKHTGIGLHLGTGLGLFPAIVLCAENGKFGQENGCNENAVQV